MKEYDLHLNKTDIEMLVKGYGVELVSIANSLSSNCGNSSAEHVNYLLKRLKHIYSSFDSNINNLIEIRKKESIDA